MKACSTLKRTRDIYIMHMHTATCKGLTCSIRAPPCPRFDTLQQSVSNRTQLFLAVYSALRAYHSALVRVMFLLPAYFIAPRKIHTELEKVLLIHATVC